MFDLVTKHKTAAQFVLLLMTVPFAFFGIDFYFRGGATADTVATIGRERITQAEFDESPREQLQRARQVMGANFDAAMFDNPDVRFAILDQVVNERLLAGKAKDEHFRVPDAQLRETISSIPAFQDSGKFSPERYEMFLIGQNTNRIAFEEKVRRDMMSAAVQEPIASANIVARPSSERFLGLVDQQREVAIAVVGADPFPNNATLEPAQPTALSHNNPPP